jgi:hypothetical protein
MSPEQNGGSTNNILESFSTNASKLILAGTDYPDISVVLFNPFKQILNIVTIV